MEMATVLELEKPLVFSCGKLSKTGANSLGAFYMLNNCAELVDVEASQCAVPEDKRRELAAIGAANFGRINRTVSAALISGARAAESQVDEVDAYNCGEPAPLRALEAENVWLAFEVACSAGQLEVLMKLHQEHGEAVAMYLAGNAMGGVGGSFTPNGWGGWYPVWIASLNGRLAVVEWLVRECGASAEAVNPNEGGSSAVGVAAQKGHLKVVLALAAARASVNRVEDHGLTPLYHAASRGYGDVIRALVGLGADVDKARDNGVTPLLMAAESGQLEVVRALVEAGASIDLANNDGFAPLHKAAQDSYTSIVRVLCRAGANVDQTENAGRTPLYMATIDGNVDTINVLIEAGASLDQADPKSCTPLLMAVGQGHDNAVRALCRAGANVDTADDDGATPLLIAARVGCQTRN